jgi:hypothetical protein
MPWTRLSDTFAFDPALMAIGPGGFALYARCLSYSGAHLTDGFVPASVLDMMDPGGAIRRELIAAGKFLEDPLGVRIAGYLDEQRSREQVTAERSRIRSRVEAFRGKRKRRNAVTKPTCNAVSNAVTNGVSNAVGNGCSSDPILSSPSPLRSEGYQSRPGSPSAVATGSPVTFPGSHPKEPAKKLPFRAYRVMEIVGQAKGVPMVEERDLTRETCIGIEKNIRKYPTETEWVTLMAFIDAGGIDFPPPPYRIEFFAGHHVCSHMARAREWERAGRPELRAKRS